MSLSSLVVPALLAAVAAIGLGRFDHAQGDAVLRGARGVEALELQEEVGGQLRQLTVADGLEQRGVPDELAQGTVGVHGAASFLL